MRRIPSLRRCSTKQPSATFRSKELQARQDSSTFRLRRFKAKVLESELVRLDRILFNIIITGETRSALYVADTTCAWVSRVSTETSSRYLLRSTLSRLLHSPTF